MLIIGGNFHPEFQQVAWSINDRAMSWLVPHARSRHAGGSVPIDTPLRLRTEVRPVERNVFRLLKVGSWQVNPHTHV